jgi:OHCU decarboxylase
LITRAELSACCPAEPWAELVVSGLPYPSHAALVAASDRAFDALTPDDWLQAFAGCSRIGVLLPGDEHSVAEQSGVTRASADLLKQLAVANDRYEQKFGFIFMIRATGRSAAEILAALEARLENPPEVEFATACAQQREIVTLRLGQAA